VIRALRPHPFSSKWIINTSTIGDAVPVKIKKNCGPADALMAKIYG
jgi:hypothetical protein